MLLDYIAERNSQAADQMQALFSRLVERLPEQPMLYREGREPGTREAIVHPNYVLVYRVERSAIRIVSVLHASQQYP